MPKRLCFREFEKVSFILPGAKSGAARKPPLIETQKVTCPLRLIRFPDYPSVGQSSPPTVPEIDRVSRFSVRGAPAWITTMCDSTVPNDPIVRCLHRRSLPFRSVVVPDPLPFLFGPAFYQYYARNLPFTHDFSRNRCPATTERVGWMWGHMERDDLYGYGMPYPFSVSALPRPIHQEWIKRPRSSHPAGLTPSSSSIATPYYRPAPSWSADPLRPRVLPPALTRNPYSSKSSPAQSFATLGKRR